MAVKTTNNPQIHVILILSNPNAKREDLEKLLDVAYNLADNKKTPRQGILNAAQIISGVAGRSNLPIDLLEQSARIAQVIALHSRIDKKTLEGVRFAMKDRVQEIQEEIKLIRKRAR